MFNKNDYHSRDWTLLCKVAGSIECQPVDYFLGLPDAPLIIPRNLLIFSRQEVFGQGRGSEHHRFLLIVGIQGEGSVIVDEKVVRMRPGCATVVTPHQFHHYARFTGGKLLWLFFSFELENVDELNALRGKVMELTPLQQSCVRQLVERYVALKGRRVASPEITLLMALFLEEMRKRSGLGKEPKSVLTASHLVQDVARYVHHHVTQAIRIPDVARVVGLSESHLRARFQALAGIGLGAYIRRLRLHRARTLMLSTDLRLKEISEKCGYDSIYSFSRSFRQEMGTSPSVYRQKVAG